MKLCISHIAWPAEKERQYLDLVAELGCTGLEIAPSRIWKEPIDTTPEERYQYRSLVESAGLKIVSLHALLYTRPDLGLFKGERIERKTIGYIKELCLLASELGADVLVFGSPGNRSRNNLPIKQAMDSAAGFFAEIGEYAEQVNVCLCVEPLGAMETDFVTSALEGLQLVQMANSPGFGLHLDSKALSDENTDFKEVMKKTVPHARHFHISEPDLASIYSSGIVDHETMGNILREGGYQGYLSVEMRTQLKYDTAVRESISHAKKYYCNVR